MPEERNQSAGRESGAPRFRVPKAMSVARSGQALPRVPAPARTLRGGNAAAGPRTRVPQQQPQPNTK